MKKFVHHLIRQSLLLSVAFNIAVPTFAHNGPVSHEPLKTGMAGSAEYTPNCTCTGNLVQNNSFENGTTNWEWFGGNFTTGTYAAVCGTYAGHFQITNKNSNEFSQTISSGTISAGTTLDLSVYAGTHNPSYNHKVGIRYYNSSWTYISATTVDVNSQLPTMTQYTLTSTVPSGAYYIEVYGTGTGDWLKTGAPTTSRCTARARATG